LNTLLTMRGDKATIRQAAGLINYLEDGSMAIGETPFIGQPIVSSTSLGDVEIY
jgi:hypothetical protein